MFLNQKILNKLMKAACKGGLTVARKEDWIYLAGRGWKAKIKESYMPNKTKGDLITLIGELPKNGECYVAGTKEITKDEKFSWPSYEGGRSRRVVCNTDNSERIEWNVAGTAV